MKFSLATIALFCSVAMAIPHDKNDGDKSHHDDGDHNDDQNDDYDPCAGLLNKSPVCCDVDVLGIADLNCVNVPANPTSPSAYSAACLSAGGKQPKCCAVPILEQGLLCSTPVGI